MAMWKNDDEMFALMKEKLYTPVVGDILDQMGYKHQFLPASIRPLAAQVPTAPYILPGETEDKRLKVAGYACTVLENDVFEYPEDKPFGYMTEALDDLKPNEIYIATGAHNSALWGELLTACGKARGAVGAVLDGYTRDTPKVIEQNFPVFLCVQVALPHRDRTGHHPQRRYRVWRHRRCAHHPEERRPRSDREGAGQGQYRKDHAQGH